VDTGAPDGTPDDPLDILDRQLPEDEDRSGSGGQLYLVAENGALDRIGKDRFVIGRGKHCDFIINSGKVSREHAVIVQDDGAYYIEDLGSSNGTWFNKQRIKRKQVEDGDEFFICNEKIKLVLR
jgi:pSer/pThr/pTyr-binding forkhead associated (FHA) protein